MLEYNHIFENVYQLFKFSNYSKELKYYHTNNLVVGKHVVCL